MNRNLKINDCASQYFDKNPKFILILTFDIGLATEHATIQIYLLLIIRNLRKMLFVGQEKATKRSKYILAGITYGVHFSN